MVQIMEEQQVRLFSLHVTFSLRTNFSKIGMESHVFVSYSSNVSNLLLNEIIYVKYLVRRLVYIIGTECLIIFFFSFSTYFSSFPFDV